MLLLGRTLSHDRVTAKLGAGGTGEVYLAEDMLLERKVALKVLPTDLAQDPLNRLNLEKVLRGDSIEAATLGRGREPYLRRARW